MSMVRPVLDSEISICLRFIALAKGKVIGISGAPNKSKLAEKWSQFHWVAKYQE